LQVVVMDVAVVAVVVAVKTEQWLNCHV